MDSGVATALLTAAEKVETATISNNAKQKCRTDKCRVTYELGRKSVCTEQEWREIICH